MKGMKRQLGWVILVLIVVTGNAARAGQTYEVLLKTPQETVLLDTNQFKLEKVDSGKLLINAMIRRESGGTGNARFERLQFLVPLANVNRVLRDPETLEQVIFPYWSSSKGLYLLVLQYCKDNNLLSDGKKESQPRE
jgi:hypothetical protein